MHPHKYVHQVKRITEVVKHHPGYGEHVVQVPEHGPPHDQGKIVQDRDVDDAQPVVMVRLARVDGQLKPAATTTGHLQS